MRSNLPGAAKYAHLKRRLVVPQPCSVSNCDGPAHASYRAVTGHQFCMSHRQRYLLLLLAQRLYLDAMTIREAVNQSELHIWVDLAVNGDDESVEQHMKTHKDDLARFHIDESIL